MARPIRLNADYYPHSANFRNDRRIRAIRTEFGAAGFGLTVMLMEILADADNTELLVSVAEIKLLAGDLGVSATEIHSLIQFATEINFFELSTGQILTCPCLKRSLEPVFDKRKRAKEVANTGQKGVSVTETPEPVTESTQSKVEESKVLSNTIVLLAPTATASGADGSSGLSQPTSSDSEKTGEAVPEPTTPPKAKRKEKPFTEQETSVVNSIRLSILAFTTGYYWQGKDAFHAKELSKKLAASFRAIRLREPTDADIIDSLNMLLARSLSLSPYYQFNSVAQLNERYNATVGEIRKPAGANGYPAAEKPTFAAQSKITIPD